VSVIAPNTEFVYRPMAVREPFAYGAARRYPPAPIVRDAGAELLRDELGWVDPVKQTIHTTGEESIEYDALMLTLGAKAGTSIRGIPLAEHGFIRVDPEPRTSYKGAGYCVVQAALWVHAI
jgi:sulfide:quinone oxidoreductase